MNTLEIKIRPALVEMNVGDEIVFPIEKLRSVRAQASELGAILDRKYSTRMSRVERTLTVKREE
ncbi:hypothetical protein [Duncaniella muris]|jgi:hypothetical protein|uniref:hypothetical protein n=1 Tax=Duncaniella muris TaxID=2094150 RepID=UPI0027149629|nr:hypothetical protein [Duncaniella muris]